MDLDDIGEYVVVALVIVFLALYATLPWVVASHFILKYW